MVKVRLKRKSVELNIDFYTRSQFRQLCHESIIFGNTDAICVQHHPCHVACSCFLDNFDNIGMDSWLSATQHQHVDSPTLTLDRRVQGSHDVVETHVPVDAGTAFGE